MHLVEFVSQQFAYIDLGNILCTRDALHCIILNGFVINCIVCMAMLGVAWYSMVLCGNAWYCMVLHGIA